MAAFLNSMSIMATFLIIVALGYLARKIHLMDDHVDSGISNVVLSITCPAVVLDSVLGNPNLPDASVIWNILGVSCVIFAAVIVLALIVPMLYRGMPKIERGSQAFTITFSNVGFIGFAVCDAILGGESVLYIAIYNIICNLVLYSVGAWMVSRSGTKRLSRKEQLNFMRKNLTSPVMIACVVALFLALGHVTDQGVIGRTCEILGAMTPVAAMLVIGSTLAKYKIKTMLSNVWAYVTSLVRLIVVPALVYFVGGFFIQDPYQLASLTLVCAMPAAMVGTMLSITYGGDTTSLSQCMFLTTVLSIFTIPLVAMFLI